MRPIEIVTVPYDNVAQLIRDIKRVFCKKEISINEEGGQLRVEFDKSTGMHMHFSSNMKEFKTSFKDYDVRTLEQKIIEKKLNKTVELEYFKDIKTLVKMKDSIVLNCKYPSIKDSMFRSYSELIMDSSHGQNVIQRRSSCINISDQNRHGTVEFRMFNLHGIKTDDFIDAIKHQIELMFIAIDVGYDYSIKKTSDEKILNEIKSTKSVLITEFKTQIIKTNKQCVLTAWAD